MAEKTYIDIYPNESKPPLAQLIGDAGGDSGEIARSNRAVNYSILLGTSPSMAYDDHDVIQETLKEKKTFYSELQKAQKEKKYEYNPLATFNEDAPEGVDPVNGTTAKDHAAVWYPLVKPFVDSGHSVTEGFNAGMASFFNHLDMVGDFIGRKAGGDPNYGKGGYFRDAAGYFQNNLEGLKKLKEKLPEPIGPVSGFLGETVGGAIPLIASFLIDKVFAGPAAAEGEVKKREAITAQNKVDLGDNISTIFETPQSEAEFWAFTKGAIERGLMGSILHATANLSRPLRVSGTGALFGEQYRQNTDNFTIEDYGKSIITGGLFGTMGGKGKFGLRDVADEMVNLNKEVGQRGSIGDKKKAPEIVQPVATSGGKSAVETAKGIVAKLKKGDTVLDEYGDVIGIVEDIGKTSIRFAADESNPDGWSVATKDFFAEFVPDRSTGGAASVKSPSPLPEGGGKPAFYDALSITTEPETMNFILSDMKANLQGGTPGGLQGYTKGGEQVFAGSGYPSWFSDIVKKYRNVKTSPSGKLESVSAKDFANIIDKGLKGDKLTTRQQGIWEDANRIADSESGKSYAPLVEEFNRITKGEEYVTAERQLAEEGIDASTVGTSKESIITSLGKERDITPAQEAAAYKELDNFFSEVSKPSLEKQSQPDIIPSVEEKPGTANIPAKENPVAEVELIKEARKYKSAEEFVKANNKYAFDVPQGGGSKKPSTMYEWRLDKQKNPGEYETLHDLSQQGDEFRFNEVLGKGGKDWKPSLHLKETIKKNDPITIYRVSEHGEILPGAYVSESLQYVKEHQKNIMNGKGQIFSEKVKPSDLFVYGDPHEFIYFPEISSGKYKPELSKAQLTDIWNKAQELPNPSRPPEVGGQKLSAEEVKLKQSYIPEVKAKEDILSNPETEISKPLSKQATPKNADMFNIGEPVKAAPVEEPVIIPKPQELSDRIKTLKTELAQMQVTATMQEGGGGPKNIKNLIRLETGQVKAGDLLVPEYTALTASMKKAEQASRKALSEGKKEGVAVEKQKELEAAIRLQERMAARQEVRDIITDLKDVSKDVSTMTPFNADNVTALLGSIDLTKLSTNKQLELSKTRQFLADNPNAEMPDYVLDDLARLDKTPARDLTYDELKSLHIAVMQYAKQSEMIQKLWNGRELKDKKEVLSTVIDEMKEPGEKMSELISRKPSLWDKFTSYGEWVKNTLGIRQDSFRLIVESVSGINSTVDRVLGRDVNTGTDNQKRYYQAAGSKFREDLKVAGFEGNKSDQWGIKDVHNWLNEFVTVKIGGADVEVRRGEMMSIYRHSLNDDNRAAMTEGGIGFKQSPKQSGITPNSVLRPSEVDIDTIVNNMTPAEKAFAGTAVDNLFNNQWAALNDVFVRVNRYRLDRQENYFPKDVMPLSRGGLNLESEEGLEAFRQFTARVGLEKGMLKMRQGSQAPIYINDMMHDVTNSLNKSAAYVGLEEPMRRASALLYNKDFQKELIDRYGRETWVEIEKGLKDISGTARSFNDTEKGFMKLKTNAVSSILSLNPWIWANQPFGMLMFEPYVEVKYLIKGMVDSTIHPTETINNLKAFSPMLIDRLAGGYDRDLAAKFEQSKDTALYGGKSTLVEKGIVPTKWADVGSIVPGMQAATYKVLAEFESGKMSKTVSRALDLTDEQAAKLTPEEKMIKAHEFADWVVENTQAMSGKEHQAPIQRGGAAEMIITTFGSQTNAMVNLSRRTYRQWQRTGDPEDRKTFIKAACQVFIINAAAMTGLDRLRAYLYNRDPKSFAEGMADNAAGVLFVVRDIEKTVMSHMQQGAQGFDAKWPVTKSIELMSGMGQDINTIVTSKNEKHIQDAWLSFIDHNVALAAITTGLPYDAPKQVGKAMFMEAPPRKKHKKGAIDVLEDEFGQNIGIEVENDKY